MARESTQRRVSPKPVPRRRLVRPGSWAPRPSRTRRSPTGVPLFVELSSVRAQMCWTDVHGV